MVPSISRFAAAVGVAFGLAAVTACTTSPTTGTTGTSGATAGAVSFKADVAPLLSSTCAGCHTPGGTGSEDFVAFDASGAVSYANVKNEINSIIRQTQSGKMPQGRPHLTAAQMAVLTGWQAAGTPDN